MPGKRAQRGNNDSQPRPQCHLLGRHAAHDRRQPPAQERNVARADRRRRQHQGRLREKIERFEQRFGIRPGRLRKLLDHPGVATFFFGNFDLPPRPPQHRVPPVDSADEQFKRADPMVPASKVCQLVRDERLARLDVKSSQQVDWKQQPRIPADAPQHG